LLIEVDNAIKNYSVGDHTVTALQRASLKVDEGESIALVGPSGSGKTTLLSIIGCLEPMTSGAYRLAGRDVPTMSADRMAELRCRHFGFVFQHFNLLPRYSALDNVILPMIYAGVDVRKRRRRAEALLGVVGLADMGLRLPRQLSGGEQQRVAVARALANNPAILLADEPTGALDDRTSAEILDLLNKINDAGTTLIVVTHDPEVAVRMKRTVRMRGGQTIVPH
jgi:putative ABC transport system ATP-binding protein